MATWDFSGDEVLFLLANGAFSLRGGYRWFSRCFASGHLRLAVTPALLLIVIGVGIVELGDPKQVANQPDYVFLFLLGGAAVLALVAEGTPWLGISFSADAIERRNPAAAIAIAGAMSGASLIYIGANAGAGPTIWTTLVPAGAGLFAWALLWMAMDRVAGISEAICVERDSAAGVRLAATLVATGLVLGRAVAGDWTDWDSTWRDFFRFGWPVIPLAVLSCGLQRFARLSAADVQIALLKKTDRRVRKAMLTGLLLLGISAACVIWDGWPDIGKHVITYEQYMKASDE